MFESWIVVGLAILYGALLALALSTWVREPRTRVLGRWLWLAIIVVFSLVGPLAYLLLGSERSRS